MMFLNVFLLSVKLEKNSVQQRPWKQAPVSIFIYKANFK